MRHGYAQSSTASETRGRLCARQLLPLCAEGSLETHRCYYDTRSYLLACESLAGHPSRHLRRGTVAMNLRRRSVLLRVTLLVLVPLVFLVGIFGYAITSSATAALT